MSIGDTGIQIRFAALAAIEEIRQRHGSIVPASVIRRGFTFAGRTIHLANFVQGIFRPKEMSGACLSITTVVPTAGRVARYDDEIGGDADYFRYAYRDDGPESRDNRALREAWRTQTPIIYFKGYEPGLYSVLSPCFVTDDDQRAGLVRVELGMAEVDFDRLARGLPDEVERRYAIRQAKQRLHQGQFRTIVLRAYQERCTICRLKEASLLNASHILPDRDRRGEASVRNGLSLCVIHHEAYDRDLMAVTPDYRVKLTRRLLDDEDGPMLEQGLKAFHESPIHLPRRAQDHPSPEFLEERLGRFERAA
jgi:putative restriction endonuclease